MAQAIQNGHPNLHALGETAGSIAPPNRDDQIAATTARGDTDFTIAAKSSQLSDLLKP